MFTQKAQLNGYIFRNLLVALAFITVVLTGVVFLTQSLRFLEMVVEAGASSTMFWILTMLALPKSFEIIIPITVMASVVFIINRMTTDSELVVMRSFGYSPLQIARPALSLALICTVLIYALAMLVTPLSQSFNHGLRQVIQAQYSSLLFREGVFNRIGQGVTVYVGERNSAGEMAGLIIHDNRHKNPVPSTIIAQKGLVIDTDNSVQFVVYDGARHEYNSETGVLQRLKFERYSIDMQDNRPERMRWTPPDERTIFELFRPDFTDADDVRAAREFQVEINKRLTSPLLVMVFTLIALCALLLGSVDRRGQGKRVVLAIVLMLFIQGFYISTYNIARHSDFGIVLMYGLTFIPIAACLFLLSGVSEPFRHRALIMAAKWLGAAQAGRTALQDNNSKNGEGGV
ncbi:MAG: LptF/LptG family permease [Alphaproteobacteria bacterium]